MFIQQDVLQFEIPVHTRLAVNIRHRADQLGKYPFHFLDGQRAMAEEIIIKFVAYSRG
jgi:hypothetical protein